MRADLPTLRTKLAVRGFVYTLLAVAVIGAIVWFLTDRALSDRVATSAEDYLLTLTSELEIAASPTDPNVAAPIRSAGEDRIAQVLDGATGEVLVATEGFTSMPLLDATTVRAARRVSREIDHPNDPGSRLVMRATTVTLGEDSFVVVAGVSTSSSPFGSSVVALAVGALGVLISTGLAVGVWLSVRSALAPVELLADEADSAAAAVEPVKMRLSTSARTAEIAHLIDRLNSLLSRIYESQEHERAFLEDASHDLRTPIAIARAELDLAMTITSDDNTRDALGSAIEELDRLDKLTADLLILARMRATPTRAVEQIHLGHLVRKAAARMMRDPHGPRLQLTVDGNADVRGDPLTLERAIDNIISNAMKHAKDKIEIEVDEQDGLGSISVRDDGPGFSEELLASAAKRFSRDPGLGEGTGLGLSIASAIAEAHGGSLEVGNRVGGGARVTLRLPATRGHPTVEYTNG